MRIEIYGRAIERGAHIAFQWFRYAEQSGVAMTRAPDAEKLTSAWLAATLTRAHSPMGAGDERDILEGPERSVRWFRGCATLLPALPMTYFFAGFDQVTPHFTILGRKGTPAVPAYYISRSIPKRMISLALMMTESRFMASIIDI